MREDIMTTYKELQAIKRSFETVQSADVRSEQVNGYTISLERVNSLYFVKISPGTMMYRGVRNKECSYIENNSQDARFRVQQFKQYAKTNPLT